MAKRLFRFSSLDAALQSEAGLSFVMKQQWEQNCLWHFPSQGDRRGGCFAPTLSGCSFTRQQLRTMRGTTRRSKFGFFFLSFKFNGERLLQTGQIPEQKAGLGGISPAVLEQRAHPDRGTSPAHGCTTAVALRGCQVIPDMVGAAGQTGTRSSPRPHAH